MGAFLYKWMSIRIAFLSNSFVLTNIKSSNYPYSLKNLSYKRVPNRLREHRKKLGLTQKEVAYKLGLRSITLISRWESGDTFPSLPNIILLSKLYQVPIDALYGDLANRIEADLNINKMHLLSLKSSYPQSV